MEVFLYQLSIWGLALTSLMIATFFLVLWRSNPRAEMRWWTYGWFGNVAAMSLTLVFWLVQPPPSMHGPIFALYLAAKNIYVWLLLRGTLEFESQRPRALEARYALPAIIAVSLVATFVVTTRDLLGLVSQAMVAAGFTVGAWSLARSHMPEGHWITIALSGRALLGFVEAAAYGVNVIGVTSDQQLASAFVVPANWILAAHYPLDTAAEWLVAMGFLIGVSTRAQHDLQIAHEYMLSAQADLRKLVDRDPLTALVNRRALPDVFREVQPSGAVLVFFDLDGFKEINDEHGHLAGDECLVRFAAALTHSFRPSDAVVRYGGDEFLVVARGGSDMSIEDRLNAVRSRLRPANTRELPIRFSYGVSRLEPGGLPDAALHAADEAMYDAKAARSRPTPFDSLRSATQTASRSGHTEPL